MPDINSGLTSIHATDDFQEMARKALANLPESVQFDIDQTASWILEYLKASRLPTAILRAFIDRNLKKKPATFKNQLTQQSLQSIGITLVQNRGLMDEATCEGYLRRLLTGIARV